MQPWGSFSHPWLQAEEWIPASYQPGKGRHTGGVQSRPADRRGSWGAPHEQRETRGVLRELPMSRGRPEGQLGSSP